MEAANDPHRTLGRLDDTIAAATLFMTPATAAAIRPPPPDGPTQPQAVVERVEVPVSVPVDDHTAEAVQMAIAAILGAAAASAARLRRRAHRPTGTETETGTGLIDITDVVQLWERDAQAIPAASQQASVSELGEHR
jgi:hypothetical protein